MPQAPCTTGSKIIAAIFSLFSATICVISARADLSHFVVTFSEECKELDYYPLNKPFVYAKIYKDIVTGDKFYKVIEPQLSNIEQQALQFTRESLMNLFNINLDNLVAIKANHNLIDEIERNLNENNVKLDDLPKKKILYYVKRDFMDMEGLIR